MAHHTGEATGMVSLPHSPQDSVQDGFRACGTFLQRGHIAALTIRPPLHGIEVLASELGPTGRTHEATNMEDTVQGHDPSSITNHIFATATTPTKVLPTGRVVHVMHQLLGQSLQLLLWRLAQGALRLMPTSSSSSCRVMNSSSSLLNPWSWLSVAPIASPPNFTTTCQRKVGAWKRSRGLRSPPPGQSTASHGLSHLHLNRESRTSWSARGSIGGWSRATIGGCWEHRGWNSTSAGFQGASTVSMGWRSLKSLSVWSPRCMTATPVQISQHAGERIYLSVQTSRVDDSPVWREPLQALGCSMGSHPSRPPIFRYPRRLITLFRWEGAKVDPGVRLERCSMGRWRPQGSSGQRSPLRDSGGLWLLGGKPGGPGHGLE